MDMKKFNLGVAFAILLSSIIVSSCKDENKVFLSNEGLASAEELRKENLALIGIDPNTINYDSIAIETLPYDNYYSFMDNYYLYFSEIAYIGIGLNEADEKLVDFYLIPFKSKFAKEVLDPLFNSKSSVYTGNPKDKNEFYSWVDSEIKNGRVVATFYDKKNGSYGAISFSRYEWALLNTRY